MLMDATLEQRVANVEAAVASIQNHLAHQRTTPTSDWVERFRGSFEDEPAFDDVVAYGRAIREIDLLPIDHP